MLDELLYRLTFAGRGAMIATGFMLFVLVLEFMMPAEVPFFHQSISLMPFHLVMYFLCVFGGFSIFMRCWVKDFKKANRHY